MMPWLVIKTVFYGLERFGISRFYALASGTEELEVRMRSTGSVLELIWRENIL